LVGTWTHGQAGKSGGERSHIQPFRFSTKELGRSEQFEAYRAFCHPVIELSLPEGAPDGFPAEQEVWDLGSMVLTEARLPGDRFERKWRHLTKDPLDHWCLVLAAPAERRMIGFRSLARPFEGQAADSRVVSLFIPREMFGNEAAAFDHVPSVLPDTGLGRVLGDYMEILDHHLPELTPAELPGLVMATRALLAACLTPTADNLAAAQDPIILTLRERARQVVRRHLRAPGLGPDLLCRELGVSRSRLYRMFEPLGGVMRYIQRQRLLAAHAALCDAAAARHIVQIAEDVGFTDASGFSRAFKLEFGYTPREARDAAFAGLPRPPAPGRIPPQSIENLGDLLRGLSA
jgi:AraC-like DNA-binding protein